MSRLPPLKRLVTEDYEDQRSWIEKLLQPLNQFMESVTASLNRSLTFNENLDAQITTVEVTTNASSVVSETYFKVTTRNRPIGVTVVDVRETVSGLNSSIAGAVFPVWDFVPESKQIRLKTIYGLGASKKYTLTLAIVTG
jgi:hypothetical protein